MSRSQAKTTSRRKPIYVGDPDVFAVDCILKQRKNGTKTEYFVKWSGYPDDENSWVNETDVTPDLIETFNSMAASIATQTLNAGNVNRESMADNNHNGDSYFEENLQNLGVNLQLQSTTDDFQLFPSPTGVANSSRNKALRDKKL